jgi:uncharacterized membrane protein YraQ (UPF0718 family)
MEQIIKIADFILKSFIHIWPYLLVTIPLAVLINFSGGSKYITAVFGKNPLLSVLLATIVGAFSPFCSCGVIPVISSLLTGGVPLAPVMSFWIASPSMDPEIFFLSTTVLGWKLAVWRLASTFILSLLAGYITHFATIKGFISNDIPGIQSHSDSRITIKSFINSVRSIFVRKQINIELIPACSSSANQFCSVTDSESPSLLTAGSVHPEVNGCGCKEIKEVEKSSKWMKLLRETGKAIFMVIKFMGLAFLITAIIKFYLPENLISGIASGNPTVQVILATLIGIPAYTSNITALPMAGGLIELGMNKGAALSFLIAGATTTLPAMVAVWGITKRRIFLLYLSFALFGALLAGLFFNLFS